MSDDAPNDRDESPDDNDRGFGDRADDGEHWLSSLLSALESLDSLEGGSTSTSGRRRSDRTIFDYDISIRTADDGLADDTRADRNPLGGDRSGDRDRDRGRPRTRRRRSSGPSSDHHVTTRSDEDELLVTADVAGTDPDDVTVGFDAEMLVVAVEGRELERVEVPWRQRTAAATIKNGVLTVRIEPDSTAGAGGEPESTADESPETEDDE